MLTFFMSFINIFDITINRSQIKGRRLGYMGHLIEMLDALVSSMGVSDEFCALVEKSFINDDAENERWKQITEIDTGHLERVLGLQKKFLANSDPNENKDFAQDILYPKEFHTENYTADFFDEFNANMHNPLDDDKIDTFTIGVDDGAKQLFEEVYAFKFTFFLRNNISISFLVLQFENDENVGE